MALPTTFSTLSGEWRGEKTLYLGGESGPRKTSGSRLTAARAVRGSFMMLAYTWSFDGDPHEGLIMLGFDDKANVATAAWGDSWHMSARIMNCRGRLGDDGTINVFGSYDVPNAPDWVCGSRSPCRRRIDSTSPCTTSSPKGRSILPLRRRIGVSLEAGRASLYLRAQ